MASQPYFAYGSNLDRARLLGRTGRAEVLAVGCVRGFALRWHKRSRDGSGKCNLVAEPGGAVWGAVYDVGPTGRAALDRVEIGAGGYVVVRVTVTTPRGDEIDAFTYRVVDRRYIDDALLPYRWYHALVVGGAADHGLPADYRAALDAVRAVRDPRRRKS